MYELTIRSDELWDEDTNTFVTIPDTVIKIEHSLVSISKWEAKYEKAFLGKKQKTEEELRDYVRCMTLTQNVKPEVYKYMSNESLEEALNYVNAPMTATHVKERNQNGPKSRDVPTSELIYYWMIENGIPFQCEKWHLNRLMALIKVCGVKSGDGKGKHGKNDLAREYARMNAARRGKHPR